MKRKFAVGASGNGPAPGLKQRKTEDVPDRPEKSENSCEARESNFDRIPPEMVWMILDIVADTSMKGAMNARLVCRQWNHILTSSGMLTFQGRLTNWHRLAEMPFPTMKYLVLTRLSKYSVGLSSTGKRLCISSDNGGRENTYDAIKFPGIVEHLVIGGDAGKFLKMHGYRNEQPFSISSGFAEEICDLPFVKKSIKGPDLINILKHLRDIKVLTLTSIAFVSVSSCMLRQLEFSKFATLTKLDVCIGKKTCLKKMQYFFEKTECPNLTSFYLRIYNSSYNFRLYLAYIKFIAKHALLKCLSLSQAMAVFTVDESLDLDDPIFTLHPTLKDEMLKIKLKCFRLDCLVMNHSIADEWKNLELMFLKSQTQLSSLDLYWTQREMECRLDELLPDCGQTLEHFELSSYHIAPDHFNCLTISNFKKLARCNLYLTAPVHLDEKSHIREHNGSSIIFNLDKLPESITSLHLATLIPFKFVRMIGRRLKNLERISYGGTITELGMTPRYFSLYLLEHLKFPSLFELKIYRFTCFEIFEELSRLPGIYARVEDEDCLVLSVDNEVFEFENVCHHLLPSPSCRCDFV